MVDEESKPPITDSRMPGFNPEVDASHAEANAAQQKAAAEAAAEAARLSAPPEPTHRCGACGALFEQAENPCPRCGAPDTVFSMKE